MSKKNKGEITLIIPGQETWELWLVRPDGKVEQRLVSDVTEVNALKEIPSGETVLFFPLSQVTFAPIRVETTDESLYDDLISSHWEQLGIRTDPQNGVLNDYKVISRDEDATLLAPFSLFPQTEHELPTKLPSHFDISPHAYNLSGTVLVFRQELGKWTMTFYQEEKIIYAAILGIKLDEEAIRGANMTLFQLGMQGVIPNNYKVELWHDVELAFIPQILNRPVHTRKHLPPSLPKEWSPILPADVNSERRKKANKQRIKIYSIVFVSVYLCALLFFYKQIMALQKEERVLQETNKELSIDFDAMEEIKAQWDTLSPAIDSSLWPDDILWAAFNARPDAKSVRFDSFDIRNDEITGKPNTITIKGQAEKPEFITKFGQHLKNAQYKLHIYQWETPSPVPPSKEGASWTFSATGTSLDVTPN